MGAWHAEMFPAMGQAEEWMLKHRDFTFPINQRLEVPVLCLRWTNDCINRKMMFGEDGSISSWWTSCSATTSKGPGDIHQPLDFAQHKAISNRRLTALAD